MAPGQELCSGHPEPSLRVPVSTRERHGHHSRASSAGSSSRRPCQKRINMGKATTESNNKASKPSTLCILDRAGQLGISQRLHPGWSFWGGRSPRNLSAWEAGRPCPRIPVGGGVVFEAALQGLAAGLGVPAGQGHHDQQTQHPQAPLQGHAFVLLHNSRAPQPVEPCLDHLSETDGLGPGLKLTL